MTHPLVAFAMWDVDVQAVLPSTFCFSVAWLGHHSHRPPTREVASLNKLTRWWRVQCGIFVCCRVVFTAVSTQVLFGAALRGALASTWTRYIPWNSLTPDIFERCSRVFCSSSFLLLPVVAHMRCVVLLPVLAHMRCLGSAVDLLVVFCRSVLRSTVPVSLKCCLQRYLALCRCGSSIRCLLAISIARPLSR